MAAHLIIFAELPPRTRRIREIALDTTLDLGTTSAYAENTKITSTSKWEWGNYLRVRGEYFEKPQAGEGLGELPPRTRRIHPG